VRVSVIVCTYNRCQSLALALNSVASSALPDSAEWEILVVDNNSNDQTREVVDDLIRRHPGRFRYLFEPRQGKSHALNLGIRESLGDVVAFMDDDVTVAPTWLQNLTGSLYNGDWAGSGGRTLPTQPYALPRWITFDGPYELGGAVAALFDIGDVPRQLDRPPYGTNMAFQKRMFDKHGLFAVNLGPRPDSQIRGEDTEFGRRLLAAGERLRYEPSAVVYHPILDSRTRKDYLLAWWLDYGRGMIREKVWGPDVLAISRYYLCAAKTIVTRLTLTTLRWISSLDSRARFYWKCQSWCTAGEIVECIHLARDARRRRTASQETQIG
jgi:glycosyltransferase involved in cell wall biosynthesis